MRLETVLKVKRTEIELAKDGAEPMPSGNYAGLKLIDLARKPWGFRYLAQVIDYLPGYMAEQAHQLVNQKWDYVSVNWPQTERRCNTFELEQEPEIRDIPCRYKRMLKPMHIKKSVEMDRRYRKHLTKSPRIRSEV